MLLDYDQYQAFIFDMDGTLLDTMPAHLDAWELTAREFSFPFSREWVHSMGGMPSSKIVEQINSKFALNIDAYDASQFKMAAFKTMSNEINPIAATLNVLNTYHQTKRIAIGTGSQRESAERLLSDCGLADKVEVLVSANDVENHKPSPDTFVKAANLLQVEPQKCLVFEDTELGKQAAHAAGMDCIMVVGEELVFHPCS